MSYQILLTAPIINLHNKTVFIIVCTTYICHLYHCVNIRYSYIIIKVMSNIMLFHIGKPVGAIFMSVRSYLHQPKLSTILFNCQNWLFMCFLGFLKGVCTLVRRKYLLSHKFLLKCNHDLGSLAWEMFRYIVLVYPH